jgi:hypothetical protein
MKLLFMKKNSVKCSWNFINFYEISWKVSWKISWEVMNFFMKFHEISSTWVSWNFMKHFISNVMTPWNFMTFGFDRQGHISIQCTHQHNYGYYQHGQGHISYATVFSVHINIIMAIINTGPWLRHNLKNIINNGNQMHKYRYTACCTNKESCNS